MPALTFTPEFLTKFDQLQPLGEGGMGTVYRGVQRSLERPVAIKFLSRQLLDEDYLKRFTAEARLAGQVFHTNLVAVIEFGMMSDIPFIVFELVEGASLRDHVKRAGGRLSLHEALDVVRQAAEGLAVAHGIGIIHRDIKPENILIGREVVKVADFGVAKSAGAGASEKTRSGVIMGTPAYLSPEQARELPITPASDIYALGVVLYELLGGDLPFQKSSTLELLQAIVHEPPPPLEGVPPPIAALVASMLAKEPLDRPASMAACARELARIGSELDPEARIVPVPASPSQAQSTRPMTLRVSGSKGSDTVAVRGGMSTPAAAPPGSRAWLLGALGCGLLGCLLTFAATRPPPQKVTHARERSTARSAGVTNPSSSAGAFRLGEIRSVIGRKFGPPAFRRELADGMLTEDHDRALSAACADRAPAAEAPLCQAWERLVAHDVAGAGRALLTIEPGRAPRIVGAPMEHAVRTSRLVERLACELFARPRDEALRIADALVLEAGAKPLGALFAGLRELLAGEGGYAKARKHFEACVDVVAARSPNRNATSLHLLRALAFALSLPPGWAADPALKSEVLELQKDCDAYLGTWGKSDLLPVAGELSAGLAHCTGEAPTTWPRLDELPPDVRARLSPAFLELARYARARIEAHEPGSPLPSPPSN